MKDLLGKLVPVLLRPLLFALYGISGFSPRNPRLWAFGSWDGKRFTDNGAALYLYCLEHSSLPIEPVWITKVPGIVEDVRRRGGKAYLSWSPQGILTCLRAGVFVFDGYTKDINHWLSRGARRAHLRHGTGIKKIEREIDTPSHRLYQLFHGKPWQRWYWRFLIPWHDTRLDLVFATSEQHAEQAMRFYGVPRERIAITGSPRNDMLFAESEPPTSAGSQEVQRWIDELHGAGVKIFLWMPTFRDNKSSVFQESWEEVEAMLERAGAALLLHLHFADKSDLRHSVKNLKRVKVNEKTANPYLLFRKVDGMISDFSSVTYDFMLLGKPAILFHPDLSDYLKACRSLDFDYDEVSPGVRATTLEELESALKNAISANLDSWVSDPHYADVLNRFQLYKDGNSSARACAEIYRRFVDPKGLPSPSTTTQEGTA